MSKNIFITIILALCLVVPFLPCALAFGVAPSRDIADYSPGRQAFTLRLLNSDALFARVKITLDGDLAPYASLSQEASLSEETLQMDAAQAEIPVTYTLDLPAGLQLQPGIRTLIIRAVQQSPPGIGTVQVSTEIDYELQVRVPYPGVYAQGSLFVLAAEPHRPITFVVPLYNRGSQDFMAEGAVFMTESDDAGKQVPRGSARFSLRPIAAGTGERLEATFGPGLDAGVYDATANMTYQDKNQDEKDKTQDKNLLLEQPFTVGSVFINITHIGVGTFTLGTIARFDMTLASNWNAPITPVFAQIAVQDNASRTVARVPTENISLASRNSSLISAYWDTAGSSAGIYMLNVTVHYAGKAHEKEFMADVKDKSITIYTAAEYQEMLARKGNPLMLPLFILLSFFALVLILIAGFLWLRNRRMKRETRRGMKMRGLKKK